MLAFLTPTLIFKAVFIVGLVLQILIRAPYRRTTSKNKITDKRTDNTEYAVLVFFFLTIFPPLIYIFTPWLDLFNYTLPEWAGWLGVILLVSSLIVFWRAHADLGLNWSPSLEMREDHTLVTRGIYAYTRHPMYASQWLWVFAQPLLLQNWIAGPIGIVAFSVLYFSRVGREEKMMLDHFGDEYRRYMERTGRVFPRLRRAA